MADAADLIMRASVQGGREAVNTLDQLTTSATRAERAADSMGAGSTRLAAQLKQAERAVREAEGATTALRSAAAGLGRQFIALGVQFASGVVIGAIIGAFQLWKKAAEDVKKAQESAARTAREFAQAQDDVRNALSQAVAFAQKYGVATAGVSQALDNVLASQDANYRSTLNGISATDGATRAALQRAEAEKLATVAILRRSAAEAQDRAKKADEAVKDARQGSFWSGLKSSVIAGFGMGATPDALGMAQQAQNDAFKRLGGEQSKAAAAQERDYAKALNASADALMKSSLTLPAATKALGGHTAATTASTKATDEQAKALERAQEQTATYIANLSRERDEVGKTKQQIDRMNDAREIEAALKRGDFASAQRIRDLRLETEALEDLAAKLEEIHGVQQQLQKDVPFERTPKDLAGVTPQVKSLREEADKLADAWLKVGRAFDDVMGAFRSGDFSTLIRDVIRLKDQVSAVYSDAGKGLSGFGSAAGSIAGAVAPYTSGRVRNALSGLSAGAQLGSMVMPGIGTIVGAIVGAIGGALISTKPSNNGALATLTDTSFSLSGNKRTDETSNMATQAANAVLQGEAVLRAAGIKLSATVTSLDLGTRDMTDIVLSDGRKLTSAVGDAAAAAETALRAVLEGATYADAGMEKLVKAMMAAGKGFDAITVALQAYAQAQALPQSISDAILKLSDPKAFDLEMLKRDQESRRASIKQMTDEGYLTAEQFASLTAQLSKLEGLELDDTLKRYGDAVEAAAQKAAQQAQADVDSLRGILQDAYNRDVAALNEQASAYRQSADELRAYSRKLSSFVTETLPPGQQLDVLRRRFQNVASLAAQGDKTALGQYQEVAEAFRQASAQFSPDAETNRRNLAMIQAATSDALKASEHQVSAAEQQLDVLKSQVAPYLNDIRANTLSTVQAIAALQSALKAQAAGTDPRQAAVVGLAASGAVSGDLTMDQAAAYLAANKDLQKYAAANGLDPVTFAAQHWSTTGQYEAALGFRKRGLARGTDFAPGGMALVGEEGPEIVNLPRGAQVTPNDILRRLASGNDNGEMVTELRALRSEVAALRGDTRTIAAETRSTASVLKASQAGSTPLKVA